MSRKTNRDSRLAREGTQRDDREMKDREITQDHELTDAERLEMLRSGFFGEALPELPHIPGHHVCWLTTTNPRDSIANRIRVGYRPIQASDIPGWEYASMKTGDYPGCIGVNEMLAFKIPIRIYELLMKEAHHDAPNREEGKLSATLNAIREEAERKRASLELEEGTAALGSDRKRPIFEGTSME